MARGFGAYDNIIVGADDARLLIFSGTLDLLWVARAIQGDRFQAVVISTIQVPKTAGGTRGIVLLDDSGCLSLQSATMLPH
jgi:hypothetical protein